MALGQKCTLLYSLLFSLAVFAADKKMKMNFNSEDIAKVIEAYAKSSDQTFIIDPSVRGKVTIINSDSVEMPEAYNQLSSALAIHGFAISKQENTYVVKSARAVQRNLIEVTNEVPALKPERMASWVLTVKNLSAKNVIREMRNITSRDGEITLSSQSNQIIITDWTSNLNKVAEIFKQLDKPVDPKLHRYVEQNKKSE